MRYAPSVSSNGLTGPRTTSRPPRSTVTRTGLPSDSTMSSNIFDASTGVPLIATMRSPGRRPICAAGVGWPGLISRSTWSTVVVARPGPKTSSRANINMAKSRLIPGPAPITAIFFQVRWRQ